MKILPSQLLLSEVDQTVEVYAGAHLLIERMIEDMLAQALQKLIAARQIILL
ncbi:hypothetical protein D9M69_708900 [compost metagenome]